MAELASLAEEERARRDRMIEEGRRAGAFEEESEGLVGSPEPAPPVDRVGEAPLQGNIGNAAIARALEGERPPLHPIEPPPAAPRPAPAPSATLEIKPPALEPAAPAPPAAPPESMAATPLPAAEPAPVPEAEPPGAVPGTEAPEAEPAPAEPAGGEAAAPGEAAAEVAAAPGEPAPEAPAPEPPVIMGGAPGDVLRSLAATPPSVAAEAFQQAQAASGSALESQRAQAQEGLPELPAPTGIPPAPVLPAEGEQPAGPPAADVPGPTGPEAGAVPETEVPVAPPATLPPTVLAGGVTADTGAGTDERLAHSAQAALSRADIPADEVPETLGPSPGVDTSGAADPAQLEQADSCAGSQVGEEHRRSAAMASRDFGENSIGPRPSTEVLAADRTLAGGEPPAGGAPAPLMLPGDVAAGLDASLGPVFEQRVGERSAEYDAEDARYEADSDAAHGKARQDIADLEEKARADQTAAQQGAKDEVTRQRGAWKSEIDVVQKDFSSKSSKAKQEHSGKVDAARLKGEEDSAKAYAEAEAEAGAKKKKAEDDAAAKKREAEEESDGFWGWVKSKAKALIDGLKSALNFIYDNLRKLVKGIFELAKRIALAAIELARKAIVGLIKAFGALLKTFVSIALAAFPEIAARINAKIDAAVDGAVEAVNAAADLLKKGVAAALDFLASTIDSLLGLIQSFYNGLLTVIGMIITGEFQELMRRIGYLIDAAKTVPDVFETAALEELMGGDLDKPLSPAELMQAGKQPPGPEGPAAPADPAMLPKPPWTEGNVGVDAIAEDFELSPELAEELTQITGDNGQVEFGESEDKQRSMESILAEATGQTQDMEPEQLPDDGLTPLERAGVKWELMKEGIAQWWADNWGKVLLGAAAAILGFIALNIVTGGAISAAIPAIMGVIGPLFVGLTVLKLLEYVKNYVEHSWEGRIREGGKNLAKGLAAGAIELISYLTFKAGGAALKGARAAAKGVVRGGAALAKGAATAISRGAKWALERGRVLLKGLAGSPIGKRFTKLKDLGKGLLGRLRFKKFRIVVSGFSFVLEGYINPWIKIAKGKVKVVKKGTKGAVFKSKAEIDSLKKGTQPGTKNVKVGEVDEFKKLDKRAKVDDKLTPDHIPSRGALVEKYRNKLRARGRKEPWTAAEKAEMKKIRDEGISVVTKHPVHKAGRTHGGKNTLAQQRLDAKDLAEAARKDTDAILAELHKRGELTPDIVGSYLKAYNANVAKKVFGYSKDFDAMFMKYVKLAKP